MTSKEKEIRLHDIKKNARMLLSAIAEFERCKNFSDFYNSERIVELDNAIADIFDYLSSLRSEKK